MNFISERIDIFKDKILDESTFISGQEFDSEIRNHRIIESEPVKRTEKRESIAFNIHSQPLFHKNFDLVKKTFEDYASKQYKIFVTADNSKQLERLKSILGDLNSSITFTPVEGTVHTGFVDDDMRVCLFTDHEIFDRYHRYNLLNNSVRNGHMALSLKEI